MSYYESQGDYYGAQGDPIFGLGSLVGLAAKGVSRLFKKKGPQLLGGPSRPGMGEIMGRGVGALPGIFKKHPVITGAAGAGITALGVGAAGAGLKMGIRGFHISKKTGRPVRNRRMRVTNVKALRRAIRRAEGFSRIAKRVLHFTSPRRAHGRGVFKLRRRKRV